MYNCDHCQKKYKRPWHQSRHNQMKHENLNSNASAGTSEAVVNPNGNLNNLPSANTNNNFNYHQMPPQQHQAPIQQQQMTQNSEIPSNSASPAIMPSQNQSNPSSVIPQQQQQPMHSWSQPHHTGYGMQQNNNNIIQNGEYLQYAVNEQYSNKFEPATPQPVSSYDSWVR